MTHTPDQPTDNPVEEGASAVEEAPAPEAKKLGKTRGPYKKRKKPTAKSKRPEQAVTPLSDSVPRTPGEFKDAAVELVERGREMGVKPIMEAIGGLANKFFGAVNNFFDDMEGKKK